MGAIATGVAQSRRANPDTLRKLIRGDLDWIVMRMLEKDRTRRYETAHALAEDIGRHLRHEPIAAHSPGVAYRLRKFLRRRRVAVLVWSAALVVIVALALVALAYVRVTVQQTRGEHQRALAMAEDLLSQGQYRRALSQITPLASSRFVGPQARLLRARVQLELGEARLSVAQLKKLTDGAPEIAASAHFLLAWIYLQGAPDDVRLKNKAEVHRKQGERLLPRTAEAYLLRAMTAPTVQEMRAWLDEALLLDPSHYGSRRVRALTYRALGRYRDMETEASVMIGIQPSHPMGYSLRGIARRELALAEHDNTRLEAALADHDAAIDLVAGHDTRLAALCDERRDSLMRLGQYDRALADAETCLRLQDNEEVYRFHRFCALVARGDYQRAQSQYDEVFTTPDMSRLHFEALAAKYVFDTLAASRSWHPQDDPPEGTAFAAMHRATAEYRQLAELGKRAVVEGFHPSWSPDGVQLAYSRGMLGSSGIEILDLETQRTRLLTVSGKDPAWSPDGQYLLFVRDRQVLSLMDLAGQPEGKHRPMEQEEIWIIKADGTGDPRFLTRGGWPHWGSDSQRFYYHSRLDRTLYTASVDPSEGQSQKLLECDDAFPVVSPDGKYAAFMPTSTAFQIVDLATGVVVACWHSPNKPQQLFLSWSPDGRRLSAGSFWGGGLWVYDLDRRTTSKVVDGAFSWCSWSSSETRHMAVERTYGQWHHEIWLVDDWSDAPDERQDTVRKAGQQP
jgi:Tol biopolymer transport system component